MAVEPEPSDLKNLILEDLALYPFFPPFRSAPSEKLTASSNKEHLDCIEYMAAENRDYIEWIAARILTAIPNDHTLTGANTKRWVAIQHHVCAQTLKVLPPRSLVELTTLLLNVSLRPRSHIKNLEMYNRAMAYVVDHPDATPDQVKRAIKYDQRSVIAKWMEDPEFCRSVELHRGWKFEQG